MRRNDVVRILDDLMQEAYAAGEAGPGEEVVGFETYVDRVLALDGRTWIGEAKAAFDQSVTEAEPFPGADFWVARAQAAAAIASAEQARVANLIAWKALQTQRQSAPDNGIDLLPLGGDEITQQIEEGLGL